MYSQPKSGGFTWRHTFAKSDGLCKASLKHFLINPFSSVDCPRFSTSNCISHTWGSPVRNRFSVSLGFYRRGGCCYFCPHEMCPCVAPVRFHGNWGRRRRASRLEPRYREPRHFCSYKTSLTPSPPRSSFFIIILNVSPTLSEANIPPETLFWTSQG